jgi:DNA topoisomerase-2
LEQVTRTIFHPDDDELLNYLEDDGQMIEPEYYMPVIPLVLVNGSDGIGTGWSSNVPNYCPRQIISILRKKIRGEPTEELYPNYYGFTGTIAPKGPTSYSVEGEIERVDATTIKITELPIRRWTQEVRDEKAICHCVLVFAPFSNFCLCSFL